uniref:Oral-facial-digital syndrome 1 protein isoform X4 n=1 Tax=Geotrypetes seraphini TaxID=260995 RepID=A0A6P8R0H8_GEOSA|nr:oral-facial-digital syndrome 1 protein isoform X4 [Geotrypetes seraphini]
MQTVEHAWSFFRDTMASYELKELSQDELRKRLYQTFKNRGVLDTLKTQLRNQLIRELKYPTLRGELRSQPLAIEGSSLLARASNSLVADHLHRSGYEYSLSVFYPECGLQQEKLFTVQDLLQLMKINSKSKLYKSLTSDIQQANNKGVLMQILMELTDHHMCKESRDVETQTISTPLYKESLVDKLRLIDREFAEIYPQRLRLESSEAKLTEYRKQMEEQLQTEMATKLQYFKEVEIAKIRLEEKESSRKELAAMRQELEKRYQTKSEGLMSREKNAIERLQMHQEIEAKETYSQRQSLLKDIEMVRSREMELKQRIEAFELSQKLQEEKNKSIEEALRCRELAVRNIEDTYDQKLKNELLKYQIELKEEYVKRTHKVTEDENKNKEEAIRLQEKTSVIDLKKEEIHKAVSRAEELELELNSANVQVSVLTRQNQLLTENLKETKDYPQLKAEKLELQTQIKFLNQHSEESQKELQQLRDRLSYPTAEQIALQAELRRAENARKFDQDEFKTHKELLENQLQNEADRCAKLTSQLLSCEDTTKRLNGQVEELTLQLQQTQLGGGSSTRYQQPVEKVSSSPNSDIEFVATTKARIKELEKEAAYLEEAYRNYQKRLIHTAVRSSSQVRPRSPPSPSIALRQIPSTSHHKVIFKESFIPQQPKTMGLTRQAFSEISIHGTNLITDNIPVQSYVSSPRRLSSTPLSRVEKLSRNRIVSEDKSGSYLGSPHHSPRCLSPIQKTEHLSSAVSAPSTLAPPVPILNRHLTSPQQPPAFSADFSDSSKPQKLLFEDLEESDSSLHNQEGISEQAENDVPHPSGDIINWGQVTAIVPVMATSQQDLVVEEEKQSESEERRARDESGGQERQEAVDREQKEIAVGMEKKILMEEPQGMDENQEESKMNKLELGAPSEQLLSAEAPSTDPSANPLEKYMQIILQSKDQELADKNSGKEEVEDVSLLKSLSNERDDRMERSRRWHACTEASTGNS